MILDRSEVLQCLAGSPVYRDLSRREQGTLVEEVLARYGRRRAVAGASKTRGEGGHAECGLGETGKGRRGSISPILSNGYGILPRQIAKNFSKEPNL